MQQQATGSLSIAQARVLRVLKGGGLLTAQQIQRAAGLARWMTKRTLGELTRRHLILERALQSRFEITDLGRNTLAAKHPDYGRL